MVLPTMAEMAEKKGIDLLATGDFTHPLWVKELESQLQETAEGIYILKGDGNKNRKARYILGTEISCIYSQGDKGRRVHVLVFAPNLEIVHKINQAMKERGCNLMSDGRPIIGLSVVELCQLLFEIDKDIVVIPAHVWTPWFSLYGSKSGFDSLEECFGKYAGRIFVVETGLSSDPAMNWRIKELDNRSIVSFSDAHSPAKLGRELTVFKRLPGGRGQGQENFSYQDFRGTLRQKGDWRIACTIEFYPEEGKYHYTGHRNCQIIQDPEETRKKGTTCPVCGRPLTIGVMHRVGQLAGREIKEVEIQTKRTDTGVRLISCPSRPAYIMLVPLLEVLGEVFEKGVSTVKVQTEYDRLVNQFGSELKILTKISLADLESISGPKLREAVEKVRKGDIFITPGYDGVFGTVKIWGKEEEEKRASKEQMSMF